MAAQWIFAPPTPAPVLSCACHKLKGTFIYGANAHLCKMQGLFIFAEPKPVSAKHQQKAKGCFIIKLRTNYTQILDCLQPRLYLYKCASIRDFTKQPDFKSEIQEVHLEKLPYEFSSVKT